MADAFDALVRAGADGEPMAYLAGSREFYGRRFSVTPAVLIPRPETETLVEVALELPARERRSPRRARTRDRQRLHRSHLELERPRASVVTATDIAAEALAVAGANAGALGATDVEFRAGSWFDAVEPAARYDLIVSNPPYVAAADPHLRALAYEPAIALTDGADGVRCLTAIIEAGPYRLNEGGWLVLEHGYDQAATVEKLVIAAGLRDAAVVRDAASHQRVTRARR